jgi:hypothetical protein
VLEPLDNEVVDPDVARLIELNKKAVPPTIRSFSESFLHSSKRYFDSPIHQKYPRKQEMLDAVKEVDDDSDEKKFIYKPVAFTKSKDNTSDEGKKDKQKREIERMKMDQGKLAKRLERFGMVEEKQPVHKPKNTSTKAPENPVLMTGKGSSKIPKIISKDPSFSIQSEPREIPKSIKKRVVSPLKQNQRVVKRYTQNKRLLMSTRKPYLQPPRMMNKVSHGNVRKNAGKKQEYRVVTHTIEQSSITHQHEQMTTRSMSRGEVTFGVPRPGPSN